MCRIGRGHVCSIAATQPRFAQVLESNYLFARKWVYAGAIGTKTPREEASDGDNDGPRERARDSG